MQKKFNARFLAVTAVLAAVAEVLMFLDFSVPLAPGFLKMDLSDFPALVGTFALGPACGVAVTLLKNLMHLLRSSTQGVGELSNFLLGTAFMLAAGLIYKKHKTFRGAVAASLLGALCMALASFPINLLLIYPLYAVIGFPMAAILDMYQTILPSVQELWQALIVFNIPFTFVKGLLSVVVTFLIYKRISPLLKGAKG